MREWARAIKQAALMIIQPNAIVIASMARDQNVGEEGTSCVFCVTGISEAEYEPRKLLTNEATTQFTKGTQEGNGYNLRIVS